MDLTHKMGQSEILDRLFVLSGTDDDATEAFQAALDAGYMGIPGSYRVRFPLTVGGQAYGPGQCMHLLTARLLAYRGDSA